MKRGGRINLRSKDLDHMDKIIEEYINIDIIQ